MEVVYEDNHIIIVNKRPGEIVQGDKTGDEPLSETVKKYLKEKYQKPGNVFCGVVHVLTARCGVWWCLQRPPRPWRGLTRCSATGR